MMDNNINIYDRQDGVALARKIGKKIKAIRSGIVCSSCPICDPNNKKTSYDFFIGDDGRYTCRNDNCRADGLFPTLVKILGVRDLPGYEITNGNDDDDDDSENDLFLFEPDGGYRTSDDVISTFESRGYSGDFIKKMQVHEYSSQDDCRYALPVRDVTRKMLGFVFANSNGDWQDGFGRQTPYLVGMGNCRNRCGSLIVTIGLRNYAAVMQAGLKYDCVCVHDYETPGLRGLRNSMDIITMYREIVIVSSDDPEKRSTCEAMQEMFAGLGKRVLRTNIGDYDYAVDIADCNGRVEEIIENADECMIPGNIRVTYSDDYYDYATAEKLPTDIKDLDYMLYDGLSFGGVHVLSAVEGEGKSTFCEKLVLSALTKGYKCWIYSAEKSLQEFRGDLDRMSARPGMTILRTTTGGREYHTISDDLRSQIRRWYSSDRIVYYDNRSGEDILRAAENSIKIDGVRVLIVDNLMTVIHKCRGVVGRNMTTYDLQGRFMATLVDLAERYNVCIILVAHKSKRIDDTGSAAGNNAKISGSSDIGNLAHTIISYDELTNADVEKIKKKVITAREKEIGRTLKKNEIPPLLAEVNWPVRLIRLTKNRNGGERNIDGFWTYFHSPTNRIYCCQDDLNVMYGWELPDYGGGRRTTTVYGSYEWTLKHYGDIDNPFPTDDSTGKSAPADTKPKRMTRAEKDAPIPGQMEIPDWTMRVDDVDDDDDELPFN